MKVLLLLAALVCAAVAVSGPAKPHTLEPERHLWNNFKQTYNKVYTRAEEATRYNIFKQSLARAKKHQLANPQAKFGVTKFSDLTEAEFTRFYKLSHFDKTKYANVPQKNFSLPQKPHKFGGCNPDPTNYDWFTCGVCTPVYDQGQCGSCWAFSATETIESYFAMDGGSLTQLSMQQIVDCDTSDSGCGGGEPTTAYQYVETAGGLDPLSDYPYTGENGNCNFNQQEIAADVTNYNSLSGEQGLYQQTSVSSGGPVSVCVDASSWQDYQGGVLTQCSNNVDHCVQLTGYANYNQNGAYWIVRNSWGADWGQSGFIWVAIGQDLCSIGDYGTVVSADQKKKK